METDLYAVIQKLQKLQDASDAELKALLACEDGGVNERLTETARQVRETYYGKKVYIRGLIEFTNYCKNDCYYCGIRRSNKHADRYRLSAGQIYACTEEGYALGFRTFVLQGGEDVYFTRQRLGEIVSHIKQTHPDCALTLSVGEREYEDYRYWHDCGADRYLLRHETADDSHYRQLHPEAMQLSHRMECLRRLKELGYQVGAGFMVGSPGQTYDILVEDLRYLKRLQPHMVGIGPFISQKDTPFANKPDGTLSMTLKLLSILRLMLPKTLLPATTALGTIHENGRELGILAGANVVMPNLSPACVRKKYALYDHKISTGEESAQCILSLRARMQSIGYEVCVDRGDSLV